jgi:hypothetical protein
MQLLAMNGHTLTLEFIPLARAVCEVKNGTHYALFMLWKNQENKNE